MKKQSKKEVPSQPELAEPVHEPVPELARKKAGKGGKAAAGKAILAGLERRGATWRWRRTLGGQRRTFVLQARTEAEAVIEVLGLRAQRNLFELGAWAAEVEGYIAEAVRRKRMTGRTPGSRRESLMKLRADLEVNCPRLVTAIMLERWLARLQEAHPGTSTPATYLAHAKAFFKWLREQGRLPHNPAAELALPKRQEVLRDVFLPAVAVEQLLVAARLRGDRDLEFILALGFECGMRRGEISSVRADWFNLQTGTVTIPVVDERFARKGQEGRRRAATIPLSEVMLDLIERHGLPAPFVIRPEKAWGKWRYRFDFRKLLGGFYEEHGHHTLTIHDMRRSFASNRVSAGVSIEKVANWLAIDVKTAWKRYSRFVPGDSEINRGAAVKPKPVESPAPPAAAAVEPMARLETLAGLRDKGLISADEFAALRAVILSGI